MHHWFRFENDFIDLSVSLVRTGTPIIILPSCGVGTVEENSTGSHLDLSWLDLQFEDNLLNIVTLLLKQLILGLSAVARLPPGKL